MQIRENLLGTSIRSRRRRRRERHRRLEEHENMKRKYLYYLRKNENIYEPFGSFSLKAAVRPTGTICISNKEQLMGVI